MLLLQQAPQYVEQKRKQRDRQRDDGDNELRQRRNQIERDVSHFEIKENHDPNQDHDPCDDEPVKHGASPPPWSPRLSRRFNGAPIVWAGSFFENRFLLCAYAALRVGIIL
jgi:hypothetical protein